MTQADIHNFYLQLTIPIPLVYIDFIDEIDIATERQLPNPFTESETNRVDYFTICGLNAQLEMARVFADSGECHDLNTA